MNSEEIAPQAMEVIAHANNVTAAIGAWHREEQELWSKDIPIPGMQRLYSSVHRAASEAIGAALASPESVKIEIARQRIRDREFICEQLEKEFGTNPFTQSLIDCVVRHIAKMSRTHDSELPASDDLPARDEDGPLF